MRQPCIVHLMCCGGAADERRWGAAQGVCGKADCPYLHVNLGPGAAVCGAFLRGWCLSGATCRHRHLTPDMVRRLRAKRKLRMPASGVQGAPQVGTSLLRPIAHRTLHAWCQFAGTTAHHNLTSSSG